MRVNVLFPAVAPPLGSSGRLLASPFLQTVERDGPAVVPPIILNVSAEQTRSRLPTHRPAHLDLSECHVPPLVGQQRVRDRSGLPDTS